MKTKEIQIDAPRWLDPARLQFWQREGGSVGLTLENEKSVLHLSLAYAFPQSDSEHFVELRALKPDGSRGEVVGMLNDIDELDEEWRPCLQKLLERSYLLPKITRVLDIREDKNLLTWSVETDRGQTEFELNQLGQQIQIDPMGRILIQDTRGLRFVIPALSDLDENSLKFMEPYV